MKQINNLLKLKDNYIKDGIELIVDVNYSSDFMIGTIRDNV